MPTRGAERLISAGEATTMGAFARFSECVGLPPCVVLSSSRAKRAGRPGSRDTTSVGHVRHALHGRCGLRCDRGQGLESETAECPKPSVTRAPRTHSFEAEGT